MKICINACKCAMYPVPYINIKIFWEERDKWKKTMGHRRENALVLGSSEGFRDASERLPTELRRKKAEDALVGDFNNDLRPDIWLVAKANRKGAHAEDVLYLNTGQSFIDASKPAGLDSHAFDSRNGSVGDFDNDGDLDVYVVNSNYSPDIAGTNAANVLWENIGNRTLTKDAVQHQVPIFRPRSGPGFAPSDDNGLSDTVAVGELNGDGVLDLIVANSPGSLIRNRPELLVRGTYDLFLGVDHAPNHWLIVDLIGTTSNREGVGAVVHAAAEGITRLRTADHGIHFKTQNDPRLHFGFGALAPETLIRLDVFWPSGIRQTIVGVAPNQVLEVTEPPGEPSR